MEAGPLAAAAAADAPHAEEIPASAPSGSSWRQISRTGWFPKQSERTARVVLDWDGVALVEWSHPCRGGTTLVGNSVVLKRSHSGVASPGGRALSTGSGPAYKGRSVTARPRPGVKVTVGRAVLGREPDTLQDIHCHGLFTAMGSA